MPTSTVRQIRDAVEDRRWARRKRRDARRAAASPRRAARRRVLLRVLAVAAMLAAFLFLALMVGDAEYQATPIGWIPFVMMVTGIVLAALYLLVLRLGLRFAETTQLGEVMRDEAVRFTVQFENRTILYFFRLRAYFFVSDLHGNVANERELTLALAPRERYELPVDVTFEHIGTYQAGLEKVVISDFLNLFSATIRNDVRRSIRVAPKLQRLADVAFSEDAEVESAKAAKAMLANSMDYAYVRDYVPGDPLKTIHWKLSSRTGTYMTKLYEVYTNPGVSVIVDVYGEHGDPVELMAMFDCVVESGFSIAEFAREQGLDTELRFVDRQGGKRLVAGWRPGELADIVEDVPPMAKREGYRQAALEIVEEVCQPQRGQNNVVVCSANLDERMMSAVISLKLARREPLFVAVVPPGLPERELQKRTAPLARLAAANIGYVVVSHSDELAGASVG